ncbi:hypothetical protein ACO0M4_17380 [Streptomyces sp. RGM 3693]|uniref:hypothetical protein n=1 Tax=Streptomyces sp. RGM 3693 TaxID=3413284 RepID=UPI003D2E4FE1
MRSADSKPVAVVVDGYSAGNFYPAAFARLGADLVHVQSTPDLITSMAPPAFSDYLANVIGSDEAELVEQLRAYDPVCVVAGQDGAVPMADRLSELLAVPSNSAPFGTGPSPRGDRCRTAQAASIRGWADRRWPDCGRRENGPWWTDSSDSSALVRRDPHHQLVTPAAGG